MEAVSLKRFRLRDLDAWGDMAARCDERTYYHLPAWQGAVADTLHQPFEGLVMAFPNATHALLPVVATSRFVRTARSGAFGGYGGLISTSPLTSAERLAAYLAAARGYARFVVTQPAGGPLPGFDMAPLRASRLDLRALQAVPAPGLTSVWVPGPREHLADRFVNVDPASSRPRAFYYHLFRRGTADTLALLMLDAGDATRAAALVGFDADTAYLLASHAHGDAPELKAALLTHLVPRLPADTAWLDLGLNFPAEAIPGGWEPQSVPIETWTRRSLPTRLLNPWVSQRQETA